MGALQLEVVTPLGVALRRSGLDKVVVRRREPRFDQGSQIVVLPGHAPTLVRVAGHDLRYEDHGETRRMRVGAGFAEIRDDRVTLIVPEAQPLAPVRGRGDPWGARPS
ncbi:MAG: hypothetical protein IBX62_09855 [Coriobacteriia bacterium]|nr:hypothetical protein [Coriobacteriia bacterium]